MMAEIQTNNVSNESSTTTFVDMIGNVAAIESSAINDDGGVNDIGGHQEMNFQLENDNDNDDDDDEIETSSDDDDQDQDFEYPSDFDPNEYEPIEFNEEHKQQMLLILNMIIPDLNQLTSFKSIQHSKQSSSQKSTKSSSNQQQILARLTCLIQFFNDYFRPQEIWPLLDRLPVCIRMDKSAKILQFDWKDNINNNDNDDDDDEELQRKLQKLNKYFHRWLYLFYTCDEIIGKFFI